MALSLVLLAGCPEEPATVFLQDAAADAGARDAGSGDGGARSMDAGSNPTGLNPQIDASRRPRPSDFEVTSTAVVNGRLAGDFRCQDPGPDISPSISWTPGPEGTASYAVVLKDVTDPAAPAYQWAMFDIPTNVTDLPENVQPGFMVEDPSGARQARNVNRENGYRGPCGTEGVGVYELTVYALSEPTLAGLTASSTAERVVTAIEQGNLALGESKLTLESSPN